MCHTSTVTDDWVTKGCHIHIGSVELVIAPDHQQGVVFKSFFSGTPDAEARRAIKIARENCLADEAVRKKWIRDIGHAVSYMLSFEGEPRRLANGRMLEFKFLILALERYGQKA